MKIFLKSRFKNPQRSPKQRRSLHLRFLVLAAGAALILAGPARPDCIYDVYPRLAAPFSTYTSLFPNGTFVGSYTNDYHDTGLGYIPTAMEYPGGGYEIAAAGVAPGADAILITAARDAMEALGRSG